MSYNILGFVNLHSFVFNYKRKRHVMCSTCSLVSIATKDHKKKKV